MTRQITNSDYFTDENGEIRLKPEISMTSYADFVEAFEKIVDGHLAADKRWSCEVIYWGDFLGHGYVPLVAIPLDKDWCYYTVTAGPVETRKPEKVMENDFTETFVQVTKVKYENGTIFRDDYPIISAYAEMNGSENSYRPESWAEQAVSILKNIHSLYEKTLPLHAKMKDEGMI